MVRLLQLTFSRSRAAASAFVRPSSGRLRLRVNFSPPVRRPFSSYPPPSISQPYTGIFTPLNAVFNVGAFTFPIASKPRWRHEYSRPRSTDRMMTERERRTSCFPRRRRRKKEEAVEGLPFFLPFSLLVYFPTPSRLACLSGAAFIGGVVVLAEGDVLVRAEPEHLVVHAILQIEVVNLLLAGLTEIPENSQFKSILTTKKFLESFRFHT